MTGPEATILGGVFAVGIGLAILTMRRTARLDRRIEQVHEEGAADRRAFQVAMDDIRTEMHRLAGRQSIVEGRVDGTAGN